ncbi:permease [bacterium BFN5]|nr:permease [bacterium BFN5]QJW45520.1 permease [bacterium BFN5]
MLQQIADVLVYQLIGLMPESVFGEALNFFIYDSMKIFIMLTVIIFCVSILRTYFPPEKTKKILSHKREFFGNIVAAALGIVTPFCSCSAVPVFIGFIESGVPLGITFSFLIASPMINEVALVMLWGLLGWEIAAVYIVSGLTIAIVAGYLIGKFKLEHLVEEYVYQMKVGATELIEPSFVERLNYSRDYTRDILKKIWIYVIVAIGIGGFIHGYAPEDFLSIYAGKDNIWAVPMAVAIGVPLYSNAAGVIPIVTALMQKGMSVGTALAFMMAVTALSFPEMVILRNVLKPKLIVIFIIIIAVSIIFTGYLFNAIL